MRHFIRVRRHGGSAPPVDVGYALRITWKEPVPGPIVLGYGCHFGLGLFALEETEMFGAVAQPNVERITCRPGA